MKIDKRKTRTIEEGAVVEAADETDARQTTQDTTAEKAADGGADAASGVASDEAARGGGGDAADAEGAARTEGEGDEDSSAEGETGGTGSWPVDRLKPVVEAVIFAAADPLPVRRMRDIVEGATAQEIKAALAALQADYASRGIRVVEVAGGWQIRTAPEHHDVVRRLFKERPFRLSRAAIETVAVVAYRQPVTRAEIETIRGVDASGVLESLVERKLVKVAGRRDVPGRPLVYATTQEFLETFGLKDLKSLPTLPELGDELAGLAEQSGFTDATDRNAAILPLEEGEESSGHDDETARTAARADRSAEDDNREAVAQDDEEGRSGAQSERFVENDRLAEGGRPAEGGRRDLRKSGRRIERSSESEDDGAEEAAPSDRA